MFFDKHSSFHQFRTMLKKPVLIGVFAAGLSKLDATCPFEQFEEKLCEKIKGFKFWANLSKIFRCSSQNVPTGSTELLSLCPWEKKWGLFWKKIPAIAFEEWASNFTPLALKVLAGSSELHSTCLKMDFGENRELTLLEIFILSIAFERWAKKICPLSKCFFLFWQGCENGLQRVHENNLNKGVFLRKFFSL